MSYLILYRLEKMAKIGKSDKPRYSFKTKKEAEKAAQELGLKGTHTHQGESGTLFMPGKTHQEFMKAQQGKGDGHGMDKKKKNKYLAARDAMYKKLLKDMGGYRKYAEKNKADKHKKKSPYMDGIASDEGTIGREFDKGL